MAVPPPGDDSARDKRWGTEIAFDDLDNILTDPDDLAEYRGRVVQSGRDAARRLRSSPSPKRH